uniref:Uncharacterized protein n=1 Tax=Anopheles farauti TaxID=69004 RepID=A0A182Q1Z0_9DIPT
MMQPVDDHPSSHMFVMVEAEHVFYYESGRRYINKIFYHPKLDDEPVYNNVAVVKLRNPIKECREELAKSKAIVPEFDRGITESQLCVKDNKNQTMIDFCEVRSSGPLFMTLGNTVYVVGMPTVHIDDCNVQIEVFNRVSSFLDWIEAIVWPHSEFA